MTNFKKKKKKKYDETYMYQLIFKTHKVICYSIQEWHIKVQNLEKKGLFFKEYKKTNGKYEFYYE